MIVEGTGTAVAGDKEKSQAVVKAMEDATLKAIADGVNDPDRIRELRLEARDKVRAQFEAARRTASREAKIKSLLAQRAQIDVYLKQLGYKA